MSSDDTRNLDDTDPLMVRSVEKAFRVLEAFDGANRSLSLAQICVNVGLDKSAAQRFTHTLNKLGYLQKDPVTKRFELSLRSLEMARHFITANPLVNQAMPYLLHLSRETEETVNLTLPHGTDIVFAARFMSRHMLNTDVVIGTRLPAFCTAPGRAILSRLPADEAVTLLERSPLQAFTPQTVHTVDALVARLHAARDAGYATTWGEFFPGDLSVAAAILDQAARPVAAVNIGVSSARYTPEKAEELFAPLVVAAARSISQASSTF
ncbi:IclR family transcriptional regulator C-terminal domain-containing protein [Mesorhizobium sp. BAC0120]|uniref:IclR family transcriptional regulator n=1 Tax=Mesorhizobium sp. BAC0120 TaxID=3090670 RepID=UPI00298C48B7|nr:IclR family transcriptional regulator C-terminal domain-containing protein [Mesorhizobium sp. BAC0120]MDW6021847.1 IclR family transcriptional regulator C-terminal domain-containing protein [Mesorhizobium sp. BAC0120]